MRPVTGEDGLRKIEQVGGVSDAFFVLDRTAAYPKASGERIRKTYAQLSGCPKTGRVLFDELEKEHWQLPRAGRPYGQGEFRDHLRYLVRNERLHVVPLGQLSPGAARGLRADLNDALTGVASGRSGNAPLLHEVERVAKYVSGEHKKPLKRAAPSMALLVRVFAVWASKDTGLPGMAWKRLYTKVCDARNDVAHTGTEAVSLRIWTTTLTTVVMEALLGVAGEGSMSKIRDVMVTNPACAHGWQTVADVRRTMLVNDYSELPLADGASGAYWRAVTARGLAAYLAKDREKKLGKTLDEATKEGPESLEIDKLRTTRETKLVRDVWVVSNGEATLPLVVTREESGGVAAVGIVTSFDML